MTVGRISIYSTNKIEVFALIEAVFELKWFKIPILPQFDPKMTPAAILNFEKKNFHEIFVELDNVHQCTKFGNRMMDVGESVRGWPYKPPLMPLVRPQRVMPSAQQGLTLLREGG